MFGGRVDDESYRVRSRAIAEVKKLLIERLV